MISAMRTSAGVVLLLMGLALVLLAAQDNGASARTRPSGLDAFMSIPEDNPLTAGKAALGRRLFFDRQLSRDGSVSCGSCHHPQRAFADEAPRSRGAFGRFGKRNAPSLVNRGYGKAHFWDGRAATLEEQVLIPIQDADEMDMTLDELVALLQRHPEYSAQFQAAFGRVANSEDAARALASYLRTVLAGDSRVDRFHAGDASALTSRERAGMLLFRGKANCTACHLGPTFSDERVHNTGVAWRSTSADAAGRFADLGRAAISGRPEDEGAFKTPTLREVARTAPYMHDGSLARLEDVIDFYDAGGRANPRLDPEIGRLRLSAAEKGAVLAFLRSLTGTVTEGPNNSNRSSR